MDVAKQPCYRCTGMLLAARVGTPLEDFTGPLFYERELVNISVKTLLIAKVEACRCRRCYRISGFSHNGKSAAVVD